MPNVFNTAVYILAKQGSMSAMKLQKLVYYRQAWSLVWDDQALFEEEFQAWSNGPVCPALYEKHRGVFTVGELVFKPYVDSELKVEQQETINTVLSAYGSKNAQWLSDQTHSESPWIEARVGLADSERGNSVISHASMAEFYGGLN